MTEQALQKIVDLLGSETHLHPDQGVNLALAYIQGRLIEASERALTAGCRRYREKLTPELKRAVLLASLTAMADELYATIKGLGGKP